MNHTTKKFPKKAKLIADGGFYKIIKIDEFVTKIYYPSHKETIEFMFSQVKGGYAEYNQVATSID